MVAAYEGVVDIDKYPVHDLDGARGRELVAWCRAQLALDGCCTLAGFLLPEAIADMVRISGEVAAKAWVTDRPHNIYFTPPAKDLPATDPRAHLERSAKHGIAYDYIPADAPMRRLYESPELTRFVAAALGKDVLYRSADPLDAFQITRFYPGEELGWHFDNSEFSVTVMYQLPEAGGEFEYVPALRSDADPNYAGITEVLQGRARGAVKEQASAPGTFALFHGHNAMHRVKLVKGTRPRINSVLTYGERPGMKLSPLTSELFYGRVS